MRCPTIAGCRSAAVRGRASAHSLVPAIPLPLARASLAVVAGALMLLAAPPARAMSLKEVVEL